MSYWQQVWKQFKKNRMAFAGLVIVCAIFLAAIFAPYIAPYSPTAYNLDSILASPGSTHLLGTDEQGRDVFSRIVYGARISLSVGFVAVSIYVLIGIVMGALAGFYGGWIDVAISRLIEIMLCFPTFFLILAVLAFVGPNIYNIMIVIGLTGWTGIARLVRAEFLKIKTLDYILAAEAFGASEFRIILRHILPNALSPVLVSAAFGVASAILVESSLSFLGFGVPPYVPSWGGILSDSREFMDIAWWLALAPGFAIFITITAYNLVGEGLRDAIDPRMG
ncbi:MAG: ABC transporter permease [Deltaproteobacteria bacterium]|nr:ABC transporter permease [Deltaproteobacteria bacterium]